MIVPPSIEITGEPPGAEFWYELHDGQETPIYRRVQRNPLSPSVEVRNHDRERSLVHVNSGRSVGEFTLLLPNLPEAESVVLYEWSLPEDAIQRELSPVPSEIARFAVGGAIDKSAFARDTIPPRTVSDALAAYDGLAAIHLQASDNTGQVANTFYRLDEGEPQEGLTATTDEPGVHTLLFWSVDRAGIVESENRVTFTVHKVTERREV